MDAPQPLRPPHPHPHPHALAHQPPLPSLPLPPPSRRLSNPPPPPPPRSASAGLTRHHSHGNHGHRSAAPPRRRTRSGTTGDIMTLPEWQPDQSAKACPVCSAVFTFWNRRHHCRKCGRVVCASCSPHRITIPKAFVVHPPSSDADSAHSDDGGSGGSGGGLSSDDDSSDGGALQVRICEDCLGRTNTPSASSSSTPLPLPPSRPMAVLDASTSASLPSRRRRQSVQGGRSVPREPPRPQLQLAETDYCPICARPLPLLSDPSEAGREAHIEGCIAAVETPPSHVGGGGRQRSYTNSARMVVWAAGEKDTWDVGGAEKAECVICFEEFEQGVEIARLECLCRYHKKCIKDWFDRKGGAECPVHAVHE